MNASSKDVLTQNLIVRQYKETFATNIRRLHLHIHADCECHRKLALSRFFFTIFQSQKKIKISTGLLQDSNVNV